MLFQTTQAHEELRAKVRAFAEEEIKPIAFMLDQQNEFPDSPMMLQRILLKYSCLG